jgi:hypothetical protein
MSTKLLSHPELASRQAVKKKDERLKSNLKRKKLMHLKAK